MSTRDLQKMVQALPQYSEQIEKLSLHVDVSDIYMTDESCNLFVSLSPLSPGLVHFLLFERNNTMILNFDLKH